MSCHCWIWGNCNTCCNRSQCQALGSGLAPMRSCSTSGNLLLPGVGRPSYNVPPVSTTGDFYRQMSTPAANQISPWWYHSIPFQNFKALFSCCLLICGQYLGSPHSVLAFVALLDLAYYSQGFVSVVLSATACFTLLLNTWWKQVPMIGVLLFFVWFL